MSMKVVSIYLFLFLNALPISCKLNGEGHICGRPLGGTTVEEKIVGGFDVGYYKYSWYAALMVKEVVSCGGSLVGSQAVVSAAHCFKEFITGHHPSKIKLEDAYNVSLGMYNRCKKEKTRRMFFVKKVYVHEKYKDNIPYYDISLLILKESTAAYQPICLPKGVIKKRPREGSVPGLGTLRYEGATPCSVHEARLLVYSDMECKRMLNRTGNDPQKLFRAFCGGYLEGGIDTCQGDSGGPFQITDDYGNYILFGLVSFGFHCANPNLLGIYTDVSQYVDWIEKKAGFKATMGGDDNSTSIPFTDFETTTSASGSTTKPTKTTKATKTTKTTKTTAISKTTKKPHEQHDTQPGKRPINIIILKKNKAKKKTLTASKKHGLNNKYQKRKNKTKKKPTH